MDKKYKRRLITLLLSLTLIISYMPTSFLAYAVDDDPAVTTEDPSGGEGNTTNGGQTTNGASEGTATTDNQPDDPPIVDVPAASDNDAGAGETDPPDRYVETEDQNLSLDAYFVEGATERDKVNGKGNLVKSVENADSHQEFKYHFTLDVSRQIYTRYKKGAIQITIPFCILLHMNHNGSYYDPSNRTLDNTTSSCILEGSVVPEADATNDDDWYYKRITKNGKFYYVIVNNKDLDQYESNTFQFDVIYQTVHSSYMYADYDKNDLESCASLPFDVHLEATDQNNEKATLDDTAPPVYLDTSAVHTVKKELATTWESLELDEDGDDINYLYLQYKVTVDVKGSTPSSKPTQQYELVFDDGYEGAFTNMKADYTGDGVSDADYELVGYSSSGGSDPSKYKLENNKYTTIYNPLEEVVKYVLVRVKKPVDALEVDYKLTNTIKVTLNPLGGADPSVTKTGTAEFFESYKNTSPTGRFMIHKWSNSNYQAARHSRTDAYGVITAYQKKWGHQNNELDLFKKGSSEGGVDVLRDLRYFIWYEGYSVRFTDYTEPHTMTYSFEDKDIGHTQHIDSGNHKQGKLTNTLYDDDYYFSEVDFYPEAQNATYNATKKQWNITRTGNPFTGDEPIIIEAQFGSKTAQWQEVAKVKYSKDYSASKMDATGEIVSSNSSLADVSFGEYEGEKYGTKDKGFIIKFKGTNCVSYRIKHTNNHYYFMCCVKPTVNVKRTTHVLGLIGGNTYTYIDNVADMNVYDDDFKTESNQSGLIFNFARDAAEGGHLVNRIAGAAAVHQNNLLNTHKYIVNEKKVDKEQLFRASWLMNGTGFAYAGTTAIGQEYPITYEVLNKGTFFDMLPRGADFDENSLKVYRALIPSNDYSKTQGDQEFDNKYLLTPGTDYTYELIEGTYNGHSLKGLTMLKIHITKPDTVEDSEYNPGYTAVYDTVSYYEDLDRFGNTVLNATAFEAGNGTTYHELGFPDNPRGRDLHKNNGNNNLGNQTALVNISDEHPDKNNILDALTDLEPNNNYYWFCYDFDSRTVFYNQYNMSGISKRVKLDEESTWGISRYVKPGGKYQYRVRYSTNDKTTVSDIILFDYVEGYKDTANRIESEWFGTLNSMELVLPRGTTFNNAKFYISTNPNAITNGNVDLTDGNWTEVAAGADLSGMGAKCVAVDTKGFTLGHNSSMSLILNMTAPNDNTSEKIWPVTWNDSHVKGLQQTGTSTEVSTNLLNVSNQTQVFYNLSGKVWIEKVDETGKPLKNVTFTLKGTSSLLDEEGNPAEIDMSATTGSDGRAIFDMVPISGTGYYTLTENTPDGYVDDGTTWKVEILPNTHTLINGEDKTGVYIKVVNKEGTEINVQKKWQRANGLFNAPTNATVTLTLYADGEPTEQTVVLDGKKDTKQPGKAGYEYDTWKAKFTGLPKKNADTGRDIVYTVVETGTWPGFTVSYGDDGEQFATDGGTITNTEETIDLWGDKRWLGLDGSTEPPEGAVVKFTLVRRTPGASSWGVVSGYETELDGVADDPKEKGGYESEPWRAVFKNAPKTTVVNGTAVEYEYKVYEMTKWDDYLSDPASAMVESGGTITNKPPEVNKYAYKSWKRADGKTTAPEGATVTMTLYADGEPTEYSCILDGKSDARLDVTGGYESSAWIVHFIHLPKNKIVNGEKVPIVYTIKETAGWPGFSVDYPENSSTVYNIEEPTEVVAEKDWADSEGNKIDPPTGARVTFTLYADGEEVPNKKVLLDGIPATYASNNGYEYEAWKVKFPKLPKYKAVNGEAVEIKYTVKETATWPGYSPSHEDGVESGGVITNTPETTELTVEKEWEPLNMTGKAPDNATVTFTLVVDDVESTTKKVVLDGTADTDANDNGFEIEAWKAKFPNLPKYKIVNNRQVEIIYRVKETGTWPGYKVSYGDGSASYAVDGGKITNSEEMTSLSVTKKWDNINGGDNPPAGAEVTFTLFADGESTGYTVTLDGDEEGHDSIMQGGQETEPWVATFVRLPKYRIDNEGKAVEIEYTVKETGTWPGYKVTYEGGKTYAVDKGTITNSEEMVNLSVKKAWLNYDGSDTAPDNAEVTFTLYADGQPTEYSVTLEGVDASEPIMQGGEETPAWTATFVRLPKYRVNDKDELVEIEYTVKETGTWPGYTVSYPGGEEITYAADGETITNTQIDAKGSTPFEGTKNIEGRSFREYDEWTFTVTPLSGAPMNDANGNAIGSAASPYQYVLNKDSGITVGQTTATFTTPAIYFTLADVGKTYRYKITESGTVTGVTNDTTVYTVMVTIENNNDGTLKVTKKYTRPKKLTPGTIDPHLPGGRVIGGYVVDWLSDLVLGEHEVKPFDPGSGEIIPGNGGTIHPFDPGTPGGGIDEKLVEVTDDAEFTNVYTPPDLEITKKLDGYVDAGTESNVTLAFEVEGYVNGPDGKPVRVYHNYVGMTFNKNDVDPATGLYQKTVKLTGLQEFDKITVKEVYSGNYKPGQTGAVPAVYETDKHLWTVTLDNSHNGYTPGSGVVNKYENGTYVKPGGNAGGGGEPSAGNEGGN